MIFIPFYILASPNTQIFKTRTVKKNHFHFNKKLTIIDLLIEIC